MTFDQEPIAAPAIAPVMVPPKFRFGTVLGSVGLPVSAVEAAKAQALTRYAEVEAEAFTVVDPVQVEPYPQWMPPVAEWLPLEALSTAGFEPIDASVWADRPSLVITHGVDAHVDDLPYSALLLTIYADGHRLKTAGRKAELHTGDWLIFDYKTEHAVDDSKAKTCLVAITVPIQRKGKPR